MSEIGNEGSDELPIGWSMAKGSELFDFVRGVSYSKNDATYEIAKGYTAILRAGNLQSGRINFDDLVYVPNSYVSAAQRLRKGDLVIAMSSGSASVVGKVAVVDRDLEAVSFGAFCGLIRPKNDKISSWLRQYFQSGSYRSLISSIAAGININNLKREHLADLDIPLPPGPEIKRSTRQIEALRARSRKAREALEAISTLLEQFRQSVLAAAFRGDLTADWREQHPDVEPVEAVLERILERKNKRYTHECEDAVAKGLKKPANPANTKKSDKPIAMLPEIPESWQYCRLEDLSYLVIDGTHYTPKYQTEGIPFLSVRNVRPFQIQTKELKYISEADHNKTAERFRPETGDILYTKVGATYGYAARNTLNFPFSIYVSLALIKPVIPDVDSEYIELVMNSELVFAQAKERVSGIGVPDLHLIEIRDFRIPFPPLAEQQEVVRQLKRHLERITTIESHSRNALDEVDRLDQSILAKAFRGELAPQNPNDEPASVLLERIRAEQTDKVKIKSATRGNR